MNMQCNPENDQHDEACIKGTNLCEATRIELRNAKLRELEQYILAEPRRFDMNKWATTIHGLTKKEQKEDTPYLVKKQQPPCGTVACLAGNAIVMGGKYRIRAKLDVWGDLIQSVQVLKNGRWKTEGPTGIIEDLAKEALHLSDSDAQSLFFIKDVHASTYGWPRHFSDAYMNEEDLQKRAQIAVDRIEHFIATGE